MSDREKDWLASVLGAIAAIPVAIAIYVIGNGIIIGAVFFGEFSEIPYNFDFMLGGTFGVALLSQLVAQHKLTEKARASFDDWRSSL